MPEYGREYWEANNIQRRLTPEQLLDIAVGHREREDRLLLDSRDVFFIDTDATTTAVFADYYHQSVSTDLQVLVCDCEKRYDLVFLCLPDIPYDDTEDRSGEANREEFHQRVVDGLRASSRPYFELGGSLQERVSTVRKVLASTKKYQNPHDWKINA